MLILDSELLLRKRWRMTRLNAPNTLTPAHDDERFDDAVAPKLILSKYAQLSGAGVAVVRYVHVGVSLCC